MDKNQKRQDLYVINSELKDAIVEVIGVSKSDLPNHVIYNVLSALQGLKSVEVQKDDESKSETQE